MKRKFKSIHFGMVVVAATQSLAGWAMPARPAPVRPAPPAPRPAPPAPRPVPPAPRPLPPPVVSRPPVFNPPPRPAPQPRPPVFNPPAGPPVVTRPPVVRPPAPHPQPTRPPGAVRPPVRPNPVPTQPPVVVRPPVRPNPQPTNPPVVVRPPVRPNPQPTRPPVVVRPPVPNPQPTRPPGGPRPQPTRPPVVVAPPIRPPRPLPPIARRPATPPPIVSNPNLGGRPARRAPVNATPPAAIVHRQPPVKEVTRNGTQFRKYSDGTTKLVSQSGATRTITREGHVILTNAQGRVTSEIRGAKKISYHADMSRTVRYGNREVHEKLERHGNRDWMVRSYTFKSSFVKHEIRTRGWFGAAHCSSWRQPLWFYNTSLALGALNYAFFSDTWVNPYVAPWGYDKWNALYASSGYGWWGHHSRSWSPLSRWYTGSRYRPSYALVDFILASTYENSWEARMEAARERGRRLYASRTLESEGDGSSTPPYQNVDEAVNQVVNEEVEKAKAEGGAPGAVPDASGPTQEDQKKLVDQVEEIGRDRQNATPVVDGFEKALASNDYLFLIAGEAPSGSFDAGGGSQCELHTGDILQKDVAIDGTGLVTMKVKVGQANSCKAGSNVTMTVAQLQSIYNAFQAAMDGGAQQLADTNQPGSGAPAPDQPVPTDPNPAPTNPEPDPGNPDSGNPAGPVEPSPSEPSPSAPLEVISSEPASDDLQQSVKEYDLI